jgi:hypothetical protein
VFPKLGFRFSAVRVSALGFPDPPNNRLPGFSFSCRPVVFMFCRPVVPSSRQFIPNGVGGLLYIQLKQAKLFFLSIRIPQFLLFNQHSAFDNPQIPFCGNGKAIIENENNAALF